MADPPKDDPHGASSRISERIRRREREEKQAERQHQKLARLSKRFGRDLTSLTKAVISTVRRRSKPPRQPRQAPPPDALTPPPEHVTRALRRQALARIRHVVVGGSPRASQPVSADGFSTFHFHVDHCSKSIANPGQASAHQHYLERSTAIARMADTGQGQTPAAGRTASDPDRHPELGTATIAAGDRLETSSISPAPPERTQYWDLVEDYESEPADYLTLRGDGLSELPRLLALPDCPGILKSANLEKSRRKYGFIIPGSELEITETIEWIRRHSTIEADADPGRSGRIQYRMNFGLPHELTDRQRFEILTRLCQALFHRPDGVVLPYYGCLHRPGVTNDERNDHGHIAFHDRPTKKIDGRWDFTVPKRRTNRHWGDHGQKKDRRFHDRYWPIQAKTILADLCNEYLAASGHRKRVHPGSFIDLNVDETPTTHVGTKASALERAGVQTQAALATARIEASRAEQAITTKRETRRKAMEDDIAKLDLTAEQLARAEISRQLREFREHRTVIDDLTQAREKRELQDRHAYGHLPARRAALDTAIERLDHSLSSGTARKPERAAKALAEKRAQRDALENQIAALLLDQLATSDAIIAGDVETKRRRKLAREAYIDLAVLADRIEQAHLNPKEIGESRNRLQRLEERAVMRNLLRSRLGSGHGQAT